MAAPRSSTPTKVYQFTSHVFTGLPPINGIQISMDGTGCWRDNVFVE
jgi:putative transposase